MLNYQRRHFTIHIYVLIDKFLKNLIFLEQLMLHTIITKKNSEQNSFFKIEICFLFLLFY